MIHILAILLYLGAFVLWVRALLGDRGERDARSASWVATAGVGAHLAALVVFTLRYAELPLSGLAPSLSTLGLITGLGLLAARGLGEGGRLGILLLPLMLGLEGTAVFLGMEPAPGDLDFDGAWFALHVTLALAAIGTMAVSGAAGVLYLIQHRQLKHKRLGRLFRFAPPLATLGRIGRTTAVTSLVMLTLALTLGWAWTVRFRGSFQGQDPKTVWSVFIWGVIVAAVLARRGRRGGADRRGAVASVVGFVLIVASYLLLRVAVGGGLFL